MQIGGHNERQVSIKMTMYAGGGDRDACKQMGRQAMGLWHARLGR